jgi:formylglycine-generating enzyme required for sulfatase activity
VPPLREWLTRKQKETWRGRAELTLIERTNQWKRTRESRFLPSWPEYVSIICGVPRRRRTPPQQALLRAATRHHAVRWGTLMAVLLVAAVLVQQLLFRARAENDRNRAEALVEALLTAPPDAVPYAIESLKPLRELAIPILRSRFEDKWLNAPHRLHAAYGLIAFGYRGEFDAGVFPLSARASNSDAAIDFVVAEATHAGPEEYPNIKAAVEQAAERAKVSLAGKFQQALAERNIKAHCRLAALLLHLGDEAAAVQCVSPPEDAETSMIDPTRRTEFIHGAFPLWRPDAPQLKAILESTESAALRVALCLAVGLLEENEARARGHSVVLGPLLSKFYETAPDRATHSAAGWTLRRWQLPLPKLPRGTLSQASPSREWFVNTHGMTLIKIPAGKFMMGDESPLRSMRYELPTKPLEVTFSKSFWMADREITVEQFQQFAQDSKYFEENPSERLDGFKGHDPEVSKTADCPTQQVSWEDAVAFCNWLSRKEDLTPCYEKRRVAKEKTGTDETGATEWLLKDDADGYRLPGEAAWEYACRARTKTAYCFGDDEALLRHYAVYSATTEKSIFGSNPGGSKLPNLWGLFDMHGNVYEWCQDVDNMRGGGKTDPPMRVLRGGAFGIYGVYSRSAYRISQTPWHRAYGFGFRVAAMPSRK